MATMSVPSASRLLARSAIRSSARPTLALRCSPFLTRPFSQTQTTNAEPTKTGKGSSILSSMYGPATTSPAANNASKDTSATNAGTPNMMDILRGAVGKGADADKLFDENDSSQDEADALEPYHFHIYSHKHNTHVTVTKPDRGAIISMSAGNIGFRKARRRSYDAAYQLTAYVLERLKYGGWHQKINRIELVLRGFGQGREAGVKVLMSPEGAMWRDKVVRVADSTRIKFGGTRSKNPRRV